MKPKVVGVTLIGSRYENGFRHEGYATVELSNGKTVFVPEEKASFDGALEFVGRDADVKEMRERLDAWVRTGVMPPPKP